MRWDVPPPMCASKWERVGGHPLSHHQVSHKLIHWAGHWGSIAGEQVTKQKRKESKEGWNEQEAFHSGCNHVELSWMKHQQPLCFCPQNDKHVPLSLWPSSWASPSSPQARRAPLSKSCHLVPSSSLPALWSSWESKETAPFFLPSPTAPTKPLPPPHLSSGKNKAQMSYQLTSFVFSSEAGFVWLLGMPVFWEWKPRECLFGYPKKECQGHGHRKTGNEPRSSSDCINWELQAFTLKRIK